MLLWGMYELFILIFGGFITAFLSRPLVDRIERKGLPRAVAIGVFFTSVIVFLLVSLFVSVPIIMDQVHDVTMNQSVYSQQIDKQISEMRHFAEGFLNPADVATFEKTTIDNISYYVESSEEILISTLKMIGSQMTMILFIPVLAFFFLTQGHMIQKELVRHVPNRYFEMTLMMIHYVNKSISGYLRGQFLNCLTIGVMAAIGLSIIGVKGAIIIGLFAGLANAIPYLGPLIGAIPAIIILVIDPSSTSPWWTVLIVFLIINITDNIYVYPMTVGKSLELHPLVAILGILFGGAIGGVLGMIVAVPLISIFTKIFRVFHTTLRFYRII